MAGIPLLNVEQPITVRLLGARVFVITRLLTKYSTDLFDKLSRQTNGNHLHAVFRMIESSISFMLYTIVN